MDGSNQLPNSSDATKSSTIMLSEMRSLFNSAKERLLQYINKALTFLGIEVTLILFYVANDQIGKFRNVFKQPDVGWGVVIIIATAAFLVAMVMFIIVIAHGTISYPPDVQKLINDNLGAREKYLAMTPVELNQELIKEYNRCTKGCVKNIRRLKILSNVGIFMLIGGIFLLLTFSVIGIQ